VRETERDVIRVRNSISQSEGKLIWISKMTAFWDVAPCSLVVVHDVSGVLAASIISRRP
jgi:hypothetical protein